MAGQVHVAEEDLETEVDKGARAAPAEQGAKAGPAGQEARAGHKPSRAELMVRIKLTKPAGQGAWVALGQPLGRQRALKWILRAPGLERALEWTQGLEWAPEWTLRAPRLERVHEWILRAPGLKQTLE